MNKMLRGPSWLAMALTALNSVFLGALAFAQSQTPSVDLTVKTTRTTSTMWYSEWWVWAVGIAVFLIVIVALTTRGRRV